MYEPSQQDKKTIWNKEWRMQNLYRIRTEDKKIIPFKFNDVQKKLFQYHKEKKFKKIRDIILKSRKQGITTYYCIFYLDETLFIPNTTSAIIAHKRDDLQKIFQIVKFAYERMPAGLKLNKKIWKKPLADYDNRNELFFRDINSSIFIALEGRGGTINNLHVSEASKIPENAVEERMASIMEAVPNIELGSNISIESTADGLGGWFYDTYTEATNGNNEFKDIFFSWIEKKSNKLTPPKNWKPKKETQEEKQKIIKHYGIKPTKAQMYWWETRKSRQKSLMGQEHPTISDDAFVSSKLNVFDIEKLRKIKIKEPIREYKGWKILSEPKNRRYIIAGDPAEGTGGDYSAGAVIDTITLQEVAYYYEHAKPKDFADALVDIAKLYNNGIIVSERNNHGHAVIDRLKQIYDNIFVEVIFDEIKRKKTKKVGWNTNARTRDLILDKLEELIDEEGFIPNNKVLKKEMINFVIKDGKREARAGQHDDLIMATAIGIFVALMPKRSFDIYQI